jgi:hypothetical protein
MDTKRTNIKFYVNIYNKNVKVDALKFYSDEEPQAKYYIKNKGNECPWLEFKLIKVTTTIQEEEITDV